MNIYYEVTWNIWFWHNVPNIYHKFAYKNKWIVNDAKILQTYIYLKKYIVTKRSVYIEITLIFPLYIIY